MATGLLSTVAHPERIVGAIKNANWRDPAEVLGKVAVELVGGKGAGGIVKGGLKTSLKTGVKEAVEQGAKETARKGVRERLSDLARDLNCKVLRKEPVDMATGRMVLSRTDIALPADFPFEFTRTFESAYRNGGWFGPAWASTVDEHLEVDTEGVCHVAADGSVRAYPHPAPGTSVIPNGGLPWQLDRQVDGSYTLTDPESGLIRTFAAPVGAEPGGDGMAPIVSIADRGGSWISVEWDVATGAPLSVNHSGGYELRFTTVGGRIGALWLAGGAPDGTDQLLKTYSYNEAGHLIAVGDSQGRTVRYGIDERGRIVSWTDSNDSTFRYTYDDEDRCVYHEGEAGHLRATFEYGLPAPTPGHHITRTTDSLGHTELFEINAIAADRRRDRPQRIHHPHHIRRPAPPSHRHRPPRSHNRL
ncbi:DUF6531 domain-containing protein [Streptomyces cavernicola]|uniref:DUF6531 domain-containing protein n=1 Tax=Streptomyces cavernicola TaxID=3043613 RepID=A0ABT6SBS6_9ACTN|nr:DUF6531 domain-containing protein [Streptomyces sp. B-S-A6]MDI3405405.1 DUF6531 domain-containing protein [Streptomyces sp. B-S-A6]